MLTQTGTVHLSGSKKFSNAIGGPHVLNTKVDIQIDPSVLLNLLHGLLGQRYLFAFYTI